MGEQATFTPIDVELRDGRRVRLREIRPDDRDEIRQAFDRLSGESRYTRFMSTMKEVSPQLLERAVHLQTERELGLVAEVTHRTVSTSWPAPASTFRWTVRPASSRSPLPTAGKGRDWPRV